LQKNLIHQHLQKILSFLLILTYLTPLSTLLSASIEDYNPNAHWSCDESSGVRYDSTINNNDLTDNNTVLSGTGLKGNACDFEATDSEYLSINDASQTGLDTSTYSLSFWYKQESSGNRGLYSFGNVGGDIASNFENSGGVFYYASYDTGGSDGGSFSKSYTLTTGTWFHILVVRDQSGNNCDLFINGSDQTINCTSAVDVIKNTTGQVRFGWSNTNYADGLIDEISYFPTAMTLTDAGVLYNGGTPLDYASPAPSSTPTTTTASSTVNMSDTNFMLAVVIFFLTFIFLGLAFSTVNRKK